MNEVQKLQKRIVIFFTKILERYSGNVDFNFDNPVEYLS